MSVKLFDTVWFLECLIYPDTKISVNTFSLVLQNDGDTKKYKNWNMNRWSQCVADTNYFSVDDS